MLSAESCIEDPSSPGPSQHCSAVGFAWVLFQGQPGTLRCLALTVKTLMMLGLLLALVATSAADVNDEPDADLSSLAGYASQRLSIP